MIKPQQVPTLFEDFKRSLKLPAMAYSHVYGAAWSQATALKASIKALPGSFSRELSDDELLQYSNGTANHQLLVLNNALDSGEMPLYYCDDDMSAMVEMGAKVLEEDDVSDISLLPAQSGFCYFSKGITLSDGMVIHLLAWTLDVAASEKEGARYLAIGYNDRFNQADQSLEGWKLILQNNNYQVPNERWIYRGTTTYSDGDKMAPTRARIETMEDMGLFVSKITPSYVLHSLLLMLQQPPEIVTVTKREVLQKKQAKRLKANTPSEVTIVDIRHKYRSVSASGSETDREYSRRWLVVGHWRWQPMKDKETGLPIRKRIWINPYIKGPDDKPFVATKRVHALLK